MLARMGSSSSSVNHSHSFILLRGYFTNIKTTFSGLCVWVFVFGRDCGFSMMLDSGGKVQLGQAVRSGVLEGGNTSKRLPEVVLSLGSRVLVLVGRFGYPSTRPEQSRRLHTTCPMEDLHSHCFLVDGAIVV